MEHHKARGGWQLAEGSRSIYLVSYMVYTPPGVHVQQDADLRLRRSAKTPIVILTRLTVVPPTSTTKAVSRLLFGSASCAKKLAPRIELVGPELNVRIGRAAACPKVRSVPSLLVTKIGHARPSASAACLKPLTVFWAKGSRLALRMVAFSRSSSPMFATLCETVVKAPGKQRFTMPSTISSCLISKSIGAKTPQITTDRMPLYRFRKAHTSIHQGEHTSEAIFLQTCSISDSCTCTEQVSF